MGTLYDNVEEAVRTIREKSEIVPKFAIILGTGLGKLGDEIENPTIIDYKDIPHFVDSTVETHKGHLILGQLEKQNVVAMSGRFHIYEGYSMKEITFPVRVMKALGAEILMISNVSGGMNPNYTPGDLLIIDDHINLLGTTPLVGQNDSRLGPRYPDMCAPYDKELSLFAYETALNEGISAHTGVYVSLPGPCLETRAEYRFLRIIGADAVGMSTVPEVIVGVHVGMRILAISVITDECQPDTLKPACIEDIIKIANEAQPKLNKLFREVINKTG
ncbi:MAG: purine-nucleoside phosphorylase [Planctomycetota bacterium]